MRTEPARPRTPSRRYHRSALIYGLAICIVTVLGGGASATMVAPEIVPCPVCGDSVEVARILSSNEFGSADLDTRPPDMMRSTLMYQVSCCSNCGYCDCCFDSLTAGADSIVEQASYQAIRNDTTLPPLARNFLCYSRLLENAGRVAGAGWAALKAAWACDDRLGDGVRCRLEAIRLFQRADSLGQQFAADSASARAISIDILRRAGRFDEARAEARLALTMTEEPLLVSIIKYQLQLIEKHDTFRYTIAEATGDR